MSAVSSFGLGVVYAALFFAALGIYRRWPSYALVLLVVTEPFAFERQLFATTITLPKLVLLGVAAGVLYDVARRRITVRSWYSRPIFLAAAALLLATALSVAQAANLGDATRETFKAGEYGLLLLVAWGIARRADAGALAVALPALLIAVSTSALLDFSLGLKSVLIIDGFLVPRVAGLLEGPNQLGGWIALVLPFVFVFALDARRTAVRWLNWTALFVGVFVAMLTFSRAGVGTLALECVLVVVLVRRRLRVATTAVVLAAGLGGIAFSFAFTDGAPSYFVSTTQATDGGGVGTRPLLWSAAFRLWEQRPLLGLGAGNFEDSLPLLHIRNVKTHANNVYLQSAVEGGLPLLCATIALLLAPLLLLRRYVHRRALLAAACASAVGFALHGFVDDLWFFPKVAAMWCLLIGVAAALLDRLHDDDATNARPPLPERSVLDLVPTALPVLEPALALAKGPEA